MCPVNWCEMLCRSIDWYSGFRSTIFDSLLDEWQINCNLINWWLTTAHLRSKASERFCWIVWPVAFQWCCDSFFVCVLLLLMFFVVPNVSFFFLSSLWRGFSSFVYCDEIQMTKIGLFSLPNTMEIIVSCDSASVFSNQFINNC